MILFLYGEDTYRSHCKLEEIRAKFLRDIDTSGMNMTELDGEKNSIGEAAAALTTSAFLASRRLVVLKHFIKSLKKKDADELALLFDRVPEETIAVVYERVGKDAIERSEVYKRLKKERFYPEYTTLTPRELSSWVKQDAASKGVKFTSDGWDAYMLRVGSDLWKVSSEMDKFAAYGSSGGEQIDEKAVRLLADSQTEESLFEFLDMIGTKRLDRAADILEGLLSQGESEVLLLNRLQHHFRSLLVCSDIAQTEKIKKDRLVRELGVHPFVATKVISQIRYFDRDELADIYAWLIDADKRLKLGGWPKPRMAIDMFLLKLAGEKV